MPANIFSRLAFKKSVATPVKNDTRIIPPSQNPSESKMTDSGAGSVTLSPSVFVLFSMVA